jgi:hypothetical protein
MNAQVGDRILIPAHTTTQRDREGEIVEVRNPDGTPPYLVRWSDGHTGLVFPGPEAILRTKAEQNS